MLSAVNSCYEKKINGGSSMHLRGYLCQSSARQVACSLIRECYGCTDARKDACTDRRTQDKNSAKSGPVGLVPGPELSNYD